MDGWMDGCLLDIPKQRTCMKWAYCVVYEHLLDIPKQRTCIYEVCILRCV